MGTTVTCQKAAAAFRSPAGTPMYVLFESTYSKNVRPHTPSWGCCYVGGIEGALKRIFSYAADCEGGLLQTPRGMTSPETYIRSWLRRLAAPAEMPDLAVSLTSGTEPRRVCRRRVGLSAMRPWACRPVRHSSWLRPRPAGRCRWVRAGGGC